ncbi:SH3 domain-containing protein [Chitinophagales bacterium]|nr:SH3 domain-containing protein [Chitinophagales bacterium]
MKNRIAILVLLFSLFCGELICLQAEVEPADYPDAQFLIANQALESGEFKKAAEGYDLLELQGFNAVSLFQNQGTAYYELGNNGKAMLAFERGLRWAPTNADLLHNSSLLRSKLEYSSPAYPRIFYKQWLFDITHFIPAWLWALAAITCSIVFLLLFRKNLYVSGRLFDWKYVLLSVLGIVFLLFFFSNASYAGSVDYAIVMDDLIQVRSAPSSEATVQFKLSAGSRVNPGEEIDGWMQVSLKDGVTGWVPAESLEKV